MNPRHPLARRANAAFRAVLAALATAATAALALPAQAAPATYWTGVRASANLSYTQSVPGLGLSTVQDNHSQTRYPLGADDPARGSDLSARVHSEILPIGLSGDASAQAQIGVLKSWSQVSFSGPQGGEAFHFADASGWASFGDTIHVSADGLADGTLVTYTVDVDVHAIFQQPGLIPGWGQGAWADLVVSAEDVATGVQRSFSWNPGTPPTGLAGGHFRWDYQTAVGRSFVLGAFLNTSASHQVPLASTASADLGHTVRIGLDNADARLNTVGSSGHDFRVGGGTEPTPVPAPASLWLAATALLLLGGRRRACQGPAAG